MPSRNYYLTTTDPCSSIEFKWRWQIHCRSSRKRWNTMENKMILLVARPKTLGGRICQRVRHLPTGKNPNPPNQSPDVQNPNNTRNSPIPNGSNGFNHRATTQWWSRLHPHAGRSWMFPSCIISPLHRHYNQPKNCAPIPGPRLWRNWRRPRPRKGATVMWNTPRLKDLPMQVQPNFWPAPFTGDVCDVF